MEDESSLEKKINISSQWPWLVLLLIGLTVIAGAFGMFILASTPMKNYLPGYLKDDERTATEEQHLRLDSLVRVYEVNEAYINGILNALNPPENLQETSRSGHKPTPLSLDSLMPVSEVEKNFMERISERNKYNITYASPTAAQSLMFVPVNNAGVISEESKDKLQAEYILPVGSQVSAIAEGKVIAVASSPRASGGYELIIQHPKGFLSKSSRLTNLLVRPGDRVIGGQIIAASTQRPGMKSNQMILELWRDGEQLVPAQFINGGSNENRKN